MSFDFKKLLRLHFDLKASERQPVETALNRKAASSYVRMH